MDATREQLEASIALAPDDVALHRVLADLLQARGDALGTLIAMQLAHEGAVSPVDHPELWTFMFAHREALLGRFANHWWSKWAQYEWRWGFLRRVHLDGVEPDGFFALPVAAFLRSVRLSELESKWLPALSGTPAAERLRALAVQLPFAATDIELVGHVLPHLELLWLKGPVKNPEHRGLRALELRGRWPADALNEVLAGAVLPAVEVLRLELAPGSSLGPLAATLAERFPRLERLGFMELGGAPGIFHELHGVGLLERLKAIELAPESAEERRIATELAPHAKVLVRDEHAAWDAA